MIDDERSQSLASAGLLLGQALAFVDEANETLLGALIAGCIDELTRRATDLNLKDRRRRGPGS